MYLKNIKIKFHQKPYKKLNFGRSNVGCQLYIYPFDKKIFFLYPFLKIDENKF